MDKQRSDQVLRLNPVIDQLTTLVLDRWQQSFQKLPTVQLRVQQERLSESLPVIFDLGGKVHGTPIVDFIRKNAAVTSGPEYRSASYAMFAIVASAKAGGSLTVPLIEGLGGQLAWLNASCLLRLSGKGQLPEKTSFLLKPKFVVDEINLVYVQKDLRHPPESPIELKRAGDVLLQTVPKLYTWLAQALILTRDELANGGDVQAMTIAKHVAHPCWVAGLIIGGIIDGTSAGDMQVARLKSFIGGFDPTLRRQSLRTVSRLTGKMAEHCQDTVLDQVRKGDAMDIALAAEAIRSWSITGCIGWDQIDHTITESLISSPLLDPKFEIVCRERQPRIDVRDLIISTVENGMRGFQPAPKSSRLTGGSVEQITGKPIPLRVHLIAFRNAWSADLQTHTHVADLIDWAIRATPGSEKYRSRMTVQRLKDQAIVTLFAENVKGVIAPLLLLLNSLPNRERERLAIGICPGSVAVDMTNVEEPIQSRAISRASNLAFLAKDRQILWTTPVDPSFTLVDRQKYRADFEIRLQDKDRKEGVRLIHELGEAKGHDGNIYEIWNVYAPSYGVGRAEIVRRPI